jgi:predicted lipoprotein with Yx(FWY)xxD motif
MRVPATLLTLLTFLALAGNAMAVTAKGSTITVRNSTYGRILFDGNGRALYAFTRDRGTHSACAGACAVRWPPFLVSARPSAGGGVAAGLIGTTRRAGGRLQATYGGRPLYYYEGDRQPGQVLCQNVVEFGGLWLIIRASGRLVR